MKIELAALCETGARRKQNEDRIFTAQTAESAIAVVADGMGGYMDGKRASTTLCNCIAEWWQKYEAEPETFDVCMTELEKSIQKANQLIRGERSGSYLCGTTVVLLFLQGTNWGLLSAGDSRCYQVKPCFFHIGIEQLSEDDIWEKQLWVQQTYDAARIENDPNYGRLVRAVGAEEEIVCHQKTGRLKKKEAFGLFSDGAYRYCGEELLCACLRAFYKQGDGDAQLSVIRDAVYQKHAPDNLSAILLRKY